MSSNIVRLQNLPITAKAADIRQFFANIAIPRGAVSICGSPWIGHAFIRFANAEDAAKALKLNGELLHDSVIKLTLSSQDEMEQVMSAPNKSIYNNQASQQQSLSSSNIPNEKNMIYTEANNINSSISQETVKSDSWKKPAHISAPVPPTVNATAQPTKQHTTPWPFLNGINLAETAAQIPSSLACMISSIPQTHSYQQNFPFYEQIQPVQETTTYTAKETISPKLETKIDVDPPKPEKVPQSENWAKLYEKNRGQEHQNNMLSIQPTFNPNPEAFNVTSDMFNGAPPAAIYNQPGPSLNPIVFNSSNKMMPLINENQENHFAYNQPMDRQKTYNNFAPTLQQQPPAYSNPKYDDAPKITLEASTEEELITRGELPAVAFGAFSCPSVVNQGIMRKTGETRVVGIHGGQPKLPANMKNYNAHNGYLNGYQNGYGNNQNFRKTFNSNGPPDSHFDLPRQKQSRGNYQHNEQYHNNQDRRRQHRSRSPTTIIENHRPISLLSLKFDEETVKTFNKKSLSPNDNNHKRNHRSSSSRDYHKRSYDHESRGSRERDESRSKRRKNY